jgi:hypothetical protein
MSIILIKQPLTHCMFTRGRYWTWARLILILILSSQLHVRKGKIDVNVLLFFFVIATVVLLWYNIMLRVKTNTVHWVTSIYVYCYAAPTCFGITLPSSGSVPSDFWAMGVLCLVTWCLRTTSLDTKRPSTIFYRLLLNWASLRRH